MFAAASFEGVLELILSWTLVAGLGAVAVLVIRLLFSSARGPIFPPQRVRFAPWRLVDLALVAVIFVGIDSLFGLLLGLRPTHEPTQTFAASLRGNTQGALQSGIPGGAMSLMGPMLESVAAHQLVQAKQALRQAWHKSLSSPLAAAMMVAALVFIAGGRLYQLGITTRQLPKVLIASYLVWLILTPVVFFIFWLLLQVEPAQDHPIKTLAQLSTSPEAWALIAFSVLVAAPLLEELLFRGILQPVMVRSPEVADLTILLTLCWIILSGTFQVIRQGTLDSIWPVLLLLGIGSGYLGFERLMWRWLPRPGAARAIFATSVLFAVLHYSVWPTPIPLFFLSLGLGYLGYRTQSLVGPVVAHSLFNLVTVGQLAQAR